jgi:acetoacetyl-[acyl-carrier protein] synthase
LALDQHKGLSEPDYRRACRPFGENCGFTLGEGAQFVVLMDDELALELGADIHAGIAEVYVNADGHKKSISAPGVGNYITFAKAVGLACRVLGDDSVRYHSFVQAHGTGTPQNRVTESQILDRTAAAFGIHGWPVAAIKCYLGHTMGAASGDQLVNTLGVWRYGIIPGIATLEGIAADVYATHLALSPDHVVRDPGYLDVAFLNAKGFGGNNATAVVLAPHVTERLLEQKHGSRQMQAWREQVQATREQAAAYDRAATAGNITALYRYDHDVRGDEHIYLARDAIRVEGYRQPIRLDVDDPLGLT